MGDSKTTPTYGAWFTDILTQVQTYEAIENPSRLATSGWAVVDLKTNIDTALSARVNMPDLVLINIGVNDVNSDVPDQTAWETNMAYVLDAIHTRWASTQVYIMRVWKRGAANQAGLNAIDDTYIPNVISTRAWSHLGPDERVWLEGGDDGATMSTDGIHYSAAGQLEAAQQWETVLGL